MKADESDSAERVLGGLPPTSYSNSDPADCHRFGFAANFFKKPSPYASKEQPA